MMCLPLPDSYTEWYLNRCNKIKRNVIIDFGKKILKREQCDYILRQNPEIYWEGEELGIILKKNHSKIELFWLSHGQKKIMIQYPPLLLNNVDFQIFLNPCC